MHTPQILPSTRRTLMQLLQTQWDQFAQTRAPDDLFDDDFTPVAKPVEEIHPPVGPRGRGARGSRGPRGQLDRGGRGGRGRGKSTEVPVSASPSQSQPAEQPATTATEPNGAAEPKKEGAVRGDRSATGGIKKVHGAPLHLLQTQLLTLPSRPNSQKRSLMPSSPA